MRHNRVPRLVVLIAAMVFFALFQGMPVAQAGLDPTYQVVLWDTKTFQGQGGEWFVGTAFFYQVDNEENPSYDWFFVGLKFHRNAPIGVLAYWDTRMYVDDYNYKTVYEVDAEPWYKNPFSGDIDLAVGTEATVTVHLESNGYDRQSWYRGSSYVRLWWDHDFTRADSDWWGMKSGAMLAKVQEVNGNSNNIWGSAYVNYGWFGWDWGCWCDLWRHRTASFPDGRAVDYGDSTPGQ